jgi:hypothetical protein
MFKMLLIGFVIFATGCATDPNRIRVKNCKAVGNNLYDCDLLDNNSKIAR